MERRNKRLRKRCNETLEITENLEILALDALDQADASKQAASSLSSDLELTKAAVEEAKADVLFKSSMIEVREFSPLNPRSLFSSRISAI